MANTLSKCSGCGFPIQAEFEGQSSVCAYCGENLIAEGVTIPTSLFVGLLTFGIGMFLGPAILASTSEGSQWLMKQAKSRIK